MVYILPLTCHLVHLRAAGLLPRCNKNNDNNNNNNNTRITILINII